METIETNIIDELKSCQNYHDYKRFVKKYSGIEDAVIKKLVEEASIKMENTKIRAYKISHNYRKGAFCDMTKLSSMILPQFTYAIKAPTTLLLSSLTPCKTGSII